MADVQINVDLESVGALEGPPTAPQMKAEEKDVVFIPHKDCELTVNQERMKFTARAAKRVTRDQARILIEAGMGITME